MKFKLLVADTDRIHIQRVSECVRHVKSIDMIGSASSGNEALRLTLEKSVDILITDILLPGMDGVLLLKDLQRVHRRPIVIVCTRFYSSQLVESVCRYGASYVLYKPLDYQRLPEIIENCRTFARQRETVSIKDDSSQSERYVLPARRFLLGMGMPIRLTGCMYLIEAMNCLNSDPLLMRNLSKGLYAEIASRFQSTPAQVERCLRTAIATGYERGSLREHFAHHPSNREFISYMFGNMDQTNDASDCHEGQVSMR